MKNLINNLFTKEVSLLLAAAFLFILNWIGSIPDLPFIIILIFLINLGVLFVFLSELGKNTLLLGKISIFIGLTMMLLSILANNMPESYVDNTEYCESCDDVVSKLCSGDSTTWVLYKEKNPETLARLAYAILDCCIKEVDYSNRNSWIKCADSLLNETKKTDMAYAYYGRAYKEYYGLGCEKSVNEAIRDAISSLNMKHFPLPYILLEEMNPDSTIYPDVVKKVRLWRDSVNNASIKRIQYLDKLFYPKHYEDTVKYMRTDELFSIYHSVYKGDTTTAVWKAIEENLSFIQNERHLDGLLAAYYWAKGNVDSARLYCDSVVGYYNEFSQDYNFIKFNYIKDGFAEIAIKNLEEVLHYSSISALESFLSSMNNALLRHAVDATLARRKHFVRHNNGIEEGLKWKEKEDSLTKITNYFIKQLRPNVK